MGKRRKGGQLGPKRQGKKQDAMGDLASTLVDPTSQGYIYDEADEYEEQSDNLALSKAKKMMGTKSSAREQVLAIDPESSGDSDYNGEIEDSSDDDDKDDEDEIYMEDDIADEMEERVPDDRAWGKNKRRYIGTDTTDETIHKRARGDDEELTQLEEVSARQFQERLAAELQHLQPDDLIPQEEGENDKGVVKTEMEVNLANLSRSKKLQLLKREAPEFLPLLDDMKEKCEKLRVFLCPLMEGVKLGLVASSNVRQYIITKYRLVLNYVCVVSAYMLTRASQGSARNHPVLGRLAQYRQLLQELAPCDKQLERNLQQLIPQIEAAKVASESSTSLKKKKKLKKLKLLEKKKEETLESSKQNARLSELLADLDSSDEERQQNQNQNVPVVDPEEEEKEEQADVSEAEEDAIGPDGKRAITYQISKNKGLTPSRKKEQRNPRVKYRRKYSVKLKKRKGQVREVRRELKRYEGEASGIKPYTVKSVKIK